MIDARWIAPGSYVSTLGPKQQGRAEFGLDLPAAAALLVTDSRQQIDAYQPPNVLVGTPHHERLVTLGAVRAGEVSRPDPDGISLFFSVGLAGTEAFLLHRLITASEVSRTLCPGTDTGTRPSHCSHTPGSLATGLRVAPGTGLP